MGAAGGRALRARPAIGGRERGCWVSVGAGAATAAGLRSGAAGTAVSAAARSAGPEAAVPFSGKGICSLVSGRGAPAVPVAKGRAEARWSPGVQAAVWFCSAGGAGRACGRLSSGAVRGWGLKTGGYGGSRRG